LRSNGNNLIEQHDGCPQVLKKINVKPIYITAFFLSAISFGKSKRGVVLRPFIINFGNSLNLKHQTSNIKPQTSNG